jgi:peptide/nickel transport system permease protein
MSGDPFDYLSDNPTGDVHIVLTPEQKQALREYYGLDDPLLAQYSSYISRLARFDLGVSIYYKQSVNKLISSRLPWTLLLVLSGSILSILASVLLGVNSAWRRNQMFDRIILGLSLVVSRIPSFLVAVGLIIWLSGTYGIPFGGAYTPYAEYTGFLDYIGDVLMHLFLPVSAFFVSTVSDYYLVVRNGMIDSLEKPFIVTAQAKGLHNRRIKYLHAFRASLLPFTTYVFTRLGFLVGGVIFIESVFAYPGVGSLISEAVINRDYPLMEGLFFFLSLIVILSNLSADQMYQWIDPRVNQ